ncbi:winged helix-turn-helix domain-containing protein [Ramlibacter sp. Leaf400]|uniref:winged helix-turn-helix domain-containing protein n=1 Tax=Ramlibacter sp. Leaf400 TaxID=1736365 RepID=UPI000715DE2D|nr:winged helix-turn-helix domain-containing protein [Ramlibacter sp. Leaf400]KQT11392.1 hypothetical protein ASG30_05835 [Ramlibacter sp. Leaf400]
MGTVMVGDGSGPVSRFGPFTLDVRRAELHREGEAVALRPKTFALLSYLAEHPGRVIAKNELLTAVWPGVVVNDESLSQCVRELRGALGDDQQALIKTVPRRGYLFDAATETVPRPAATGHARPAVRRRTWSLAASALLLAASVVVVPRNDLPPDVDALLKARRSVAVLTFLDHGTAGQSRLGDAISTGIVTALAKVPDTQVLAGGPAAGARAVADPRRIGRDLGVRHLLTGSAQQVGEKIRIHARLESGEDGAVVWSEVFEYEATPDDAWQRELALRIARGVDWRMGTSAAVRQAARQGGTPARVDGLMRGQHLLRHAASYDDLVRARAHFEAITIVEPGSAAAWTGMAQSYVSELEAAWNLGLGSAAQARQAIARARAADPHYLPAQHVHGSLLAVLGDLEGASRVYQAVVAANPSDAWAHARLGATKLRLGQFEEVQAHTDMALRLGASEASLVAFSHLQAGLAEYHLGRDASAYEHAGLSVAAGPSLAQLEALLLLASLDALHGRGQEARERSVEVLRLRPRFTVGAWRVWTAPVHPRLQVLRDRYLEGLAKAGLPE